MIQLHFAHANGFPAESYKKLWRHLPEDFHVIAKDKFGHDPQKPVLDNWDNQVEELIEYVESHKTQKVYAVGHSFGGVISFMACCLRPDLFKGLIMLDPPIMSGMMSIVFRFLKKTPWIDSVVPSGKSKNRKAIWQLEDDIHAYFQSKGLFKYFDEDCLRDYVSAATEEKDGAIHLSYKAEIETLIFRKVPHNIHQFDMQLKLPAILFSAQHTDVCFPPLVNSFVKKHPSMENRVVPNVGHMFPLEKPLDTAELIASTIKTWEC